LNLEDLLARARGAAEESNVHSLGGRAPLADERSSVNSWRIATAAAVALIAVAFALLRWSDQQAPSVQYVTAHGKQATQRLADDSMLRLNTDTAVAVRYSHAERLVEVERGQVLFEVRHDSRRPFRVMAGPAEVIAVGTKFDVYRQADSIRVTVVEGQVDVRLAGGQREAAAGPGVRVRAGERVQVDQGGVSAAAPADLHRSGAWLRREIAFEQEPLKAVAAEFNRYNATPIEIESPALREIRISGVFAADDTESFIAFLRSIDGVRVEVTATRIRVLKM